VLLATRKPIKNPSKKSDLFDLFDVVSEKYLIKFGTCPGLYELHRIDDERLFQIIQEMDSALYEERVPVTLEEAYRIAGLQWPPDWMTNPKIVT
jgi:hypothetical protein